MNTFICGDCHQDLQPAESNAEVYKCECWGKKEDDLPSMAEIIAFMSQRIRAENTIH